jgi:RNA polymerase sigma factor (sigma-70 family)
MRSIHSSVPAAQSRPDSQADPSPNVIDPTPGTVADRDKWESLFLSCLGTIDSIVRALARRRRLGADDAEDLASIVRLRMMADNYAILRKFQMRSSLRTYLTVVIQRVFLDERIARFGKWRPSRQALRDGPIATLFERLTTRDGLTFEEACDALEINHRVPVSRVALEHLYKRFRRSPIRRFVATDQILETMPAAWGRPDEHLAQAERMALVRRARVSLAHAFRSMTAQDRTILQLRYAQRLSIDDIAKVTGLKQKTLYSRCAGLLRSLRSRLEKDGIAAREILGNIGQPTVTLSSNRI